MHFIQRMIIHADSSDQSQAVGNPVIVLYIQHIIRDAVGCCILKPVRSQFFGVYFAAHSQ